MKPMATKTVRQFYDAEKWFRENVSEIKIWTNFSGEISFGSDMQVGAETTMSWFMNNGEVWNWKLEK